MVISKYNVLKFARIFLLAVLMAACSGENNPAATSGSFTFRRIAWESLSPGDKSTVIGSWRQAPLEDCVYYENNRAAVCVTFRTTMDALLGPIVVFIDPATHRVLGFGLRD